MSTLVRTLGRHAPQPLRTLGRGLYNWWQGSGLPASSRGTVQDLYYWVSDRGIDTNILLNNFYSVLFPAIETDTRGTVTIFDAEGRRLGMTEVSLGRLQCKKLTLSKLLRGWPGASATPASFGSLLIDLEIPSAVLARIADIPEQCFFWHRFYIEYVTATSQPAFVHCVDKTWIHRQGKPELLPWYRRAQPRDWAPEMPLNICEYRRLFVILINRTHQVAPVTLTVSDNRDRVEAFTAAISPLGVHRFELTREVLGALDGRELRLRVAGMPTTWARPVLFKEFENGTISTMHS